MMKARGIARLGLLAVGLGIGAAFASMPGIASADNTSTDPFSLIGAINPGGPDIPAASSAPLNLAISINGKDLYTHGTAVAESGKGDFAIASGDSSFACAGCSDSPGTHDFAYAHGANTSADSGFGNFDTAIANHGGFDAAAGAGNFDTAIANGANAFANAGGALGTSTGNFDFADAVGANAKALAGAINSTTINSNNDVALVLDPSGTAGSTALAGDGNNDLAAVLFADGLTANAAPGDHLVDILPTMFADAGSSAAASGGHLFADLLSLF